MQPHQPIGATDEILHKRLIGLLRGIGSEASMRLEQSDSRWDSVDDS